MSRRYFEFGSAVTDEAWRNVFDGGFRHQLLYGMTPTVSDPATGKISISVGAVQLDTGVFMYEDLVKEVTIPLGNPAKSYTVHLQHTVDQILGGSQAVLTVEEGLVFYDRTDGKTPLFWVVYPGSNAQLDAGHIFPGVSVEDVAVARHSMNTPLYLPEQDSSNDSNMSLEQKVSSGVLQNEFELDAGAGASVTGQKLHLPFWYPGYGKPRKITITAEVESGCSITALQMRDLAGTVVTQDSQVTTTAVVNPTLPITANSGMVDYTFYVSALAGGNAAVWTKAGWALVELTASLDPGTSINIKSFEVSLMGEDE